ncbi:MAG: SpoIID/LytB domain-containing protein [Synechococcus sp.]|nr:SpoIID/LytB domain-containing protein [Synechococcus sp.]
MDRPISSLLVSAAAALTFLPVAIQVSPVEASQRVEHQPQIRVLVAQGVSVELRTDGAEQLELRLPGGKILRLSRLQFRLSGGQLTVETPELTDVRIPPAAGLSVTSEDPRGIWLGQRRYGGTLHLRARGGQIQVVNQLGIEPYLASVVGSEMPHTWPLAALQAQAVAARTYALRQRGRHADYDVQATVSSQVYRGLESATPSTQKAVDSTRSLVMVHGGKLINAVFHSSSGGTTEPSGEVWRTQLPYLVSVPDHDQQSPVHRWQQRFDANQLKAAFRETQGLEAVDVLQTSSTGRLRSVRVRGPGGSLVLSGRELRQRLGLKSTMVSFNWLVQADGDASGPPVPGNSGDAKGIPAMIGFWRDSATGSSAALLSSPPPLVRETSVQVPPRGTILEVRGQGFGHGVGMSQWGARGLAEQGADFRQILQHYYRGVTIRPFQTTDDPAMAGNPAVRPVWKS